MANRAEINQALHNIRRRLHKLSQYEMGVVIGHLNEWEKDDFSDLHEMDKKGALERAEEINKELDSIKEALDRTLTFLRQG